ncbi:unnamed protein product [Rotaria magnacalcarata]
MDEKFDFRTLFLKLQDYLSNDDRRRLHFILGDTIPRHLRDDPTLSGTLSLLESLCDQAKISEQDFNCLIHAFNEINCHKNILLIKSGNIYGNSASADAFNDAQDRQLTFTDRIVNINAGWTSDTLDYATFLYSNNRSMQHDRATYCYSPYTSKFSLNSDESIIGVTIYTVTRLIDNLYARNGSYLVVG